MRDAKDEQDEDEDHGQRANERVELKLRATCLEYLTTLSLLLW